MTREEAIKHLEDMKKGLFLWDMTELIDLCISALSENKATSGEYVKKVDMERILYSTNNAIRIGELFLELPTYSFHNSAENKGEWEKIWRTDCECSEYVCSKCGCGEDYQTDFCPNCGADMREPKGEKGTE